MGATTPVSVLAAIELGASPALASLILALVGVIALVSTVPAGMIIDRIGDRRAMTLATIGAVACTAMTVTALVAGGRGALALFIGSLVLRAPIMSIWGLARQALVAETIPIAQRGRAMTALGGTMRVGALIGPLLGAALLLVLPIASVYVLAALCAVAALVILYTPAGAALESPPRHHRACTADRADDAPPTDSPEQTACARSPADQPGRLPSSAVRWKAVILAGVAITALTVARTGQPIAVQLWGVHLALSASVISLLVALGAALELVMMVPGGRLKDHLGRSPVLVLCLVVYGLGFLIMPLLPHLPGMAVAVIVMALGNGFGAGINMTIGADLSPEIGRARFLGIWALFSNVGVLVGPAMISLLVASSGVAAALLGIGAVALAGGGWMIAWARTVDLPRRIAVR